MTDDEMVSGELTRLIFTGYHDAGGDPAIQWVTMLEYGAYLEHDFELLCENFGWNKWDCRTGWSLVGYASPESLWFDSQEQRHIKQFCEGAKAAYAALGRPKPEGRKVGREVGPFSPPDKETIIAQLRARAEAVRQALAD